MLSPIVLFVYNRPSHTERTLKALSQNDLASESDLFIFADGPRVNSSEEQLDKITEVRRVIRKVQWCGTVHIIESDINKGLADSILDGVTKVVNEYGKVIVLEDDIYTSKGFLRYMNDALTMYENDEQVMQVSGYIYPHKYEIKETTCFLRIMSCWGWGTWKRAWKYYNHDVEKHISKYSNKELIKKFNIEGHARFYNQLVANANKDLYTWAVRWYASWLDCGGYTLFPTISLVQNLGFDKTGENCMDDKNYFEVRLTDRLDIKKRSIEENLCMRKSIDDFYRVRYKQNSYKSLFVNFLKKIGCWTIYKKIKTVSTILHDIVGKKYEFRLLKNVVVESKINKTAKLKAIYHLENSIVERYTYIGRYADIRNTYIGQFCSVGNHFSCGLGIHPTNGLSTSPMFYSNRKQNGYTYSVKNKIEEYLPVVIGNDVFIGDNVTVLSGVKIGDGAVIGAGAVVSKNIPPYAIAVGSPIEIKKYRFTESQIQSLLRIQWWNWDEEKLKIVEKEFWNIDKFITENL